MTPLLVPPASLVRRALASDVVDRLTAPHGIDRYLELVSSSWAVHEVRARVVGVVRQTARTVTLTLRPNAAWQGFDAGQHVVVGVEIDGVVHQRCFSLADSPRRADGVLELTVKANPAGRVSRFLVERAHVGMVVRLSQAAGEFVLPEPPERAGHLVFISGGSGITPVLAMLRTLVADEHDGPVTFVHYADRLVDVCYLDELRRLTDRLPAGRLLLGLALEPEAGDLVGLFGAEHLEAIIDDPSAAEVFLCGPVPLMASVQDHLDAIGAGDRVRSERFGLPVADGALDQGEGVVGFERAGLRVPSEGTILETAEAAGLSPAFGCRRGICGTCTTTKTAGVVRDLVTGLRSDPDPGPVRLCTSVPCGEVVVDL